MHYCDHEPEVTGSRRSHRRRSFDHRQKQQRDTPQGRLQQFSRTVHEDARIAEQVQTLKMPYMTRESSVAEIARTVSALPNLRYVDVPEGLFADSLTSATLKQELQVRCTDIRRMKYTAGSEDGFAMLGQGQVWQQMESLDLNGLSLHPSTLIDSLCSLPSLHDLSLTAIPSMNDSIVESLPPLRDLTLQDLPETSIQGISAYLSQLPVQQNLMRLTLKNTGISPLDIHQLLSQARSLVRLSLDTTVTHPFPIKQPPLLSSKSLKIFSYQVAAIVSPSPSNNTMSMSLESYYAYLALSIQAGNLPSLTHLYALSTTLLALLLSNSSTPPQTFHSSNTPKSNDSLQSSPDLSPHPQTQTQTQTRHHPTTLHLYTKSLPELEWDLTILPPSSIPGLGPTIDAESPSPSSFPTSTNTLPFRKNRVPTTLPASSNPKPTRFTPKTRPLSLYHHPPELDPQYRNTGRASVMVGNGFGGYLTVPGERLPTNGDGIEGEGGSGGGSGGLRSPKGPRSPRKMFGREKDRDGWMG